MEALNSSFLCENGFWSLLGSDNHSNSFHCTGDLSRNSCYIPESELAKRDAIAFLRSILSALSMLGTFTIILSVLVKKQVFSPKIHPIFMLSIADFCLAILWAIGGVMWFHGGKGSSTVFSRDRDGCYTVLLATITFECVTVNLTCVYALLAYASIKQKDFTNVYSLFEKDINKRVWKVWKTILVYCVAWIEPIIVILVPFFAMDQAYGLSRQADDCTCWCIPFFGNIIPHANRMDDPTANYMSAQSNFVFAYSLAVGVHYVFGFLLLFVVYGMVLARIRKMRTVHRERSSRHNMYGATEAIIVRGQSQAKMRVMVFLTVFLISGLFNVVMSFIVLHYTSTKLKSKETVGGHHGLPLYVTLVYIIQSITMPLQGFFNAIIYGWTREDFVQAIRAPHASSKPTTPTGSKVIPSHRVQRSTSPINDASVDIVVPVNSPPTVNTDISPPNLLQALSENSDSD